MKEKVMQENAGNGCCGSGACCGGGRCSSWFWTFIKVLIAIILLFGLVGFGMHIGLRMSNGGRGGRGRDSDRGGCMNKFRGKNDDWKAGDALTSSGDTAALTTSGTAQ